MDYQILIFSFVISLIISLLVIPSIVRVAKAKRLCEKPGGRHLHHGNVPTLGGCAIFAAFIITMLTLGGGQSYLFNYLTAASVILFFVGIKDDIMIIAPLTKLVGQIAAALVLCWAGDVRITSFQGLFNVQEIPFWLSIIVTVFVVVSVINAFNLIDGIDGLAGTLCITSSLMFGLYFYVYNNFTICFVEACFLGAVFGFLRFNLFSSNNKIFMGDTGAQLVGLFCAFLAIQFIECNNTSIVDNSVSEAPAIAFAILVVPMFDVLRVMFLRIVLKRSIFNADNIHIHYKLLELGLSHYKADLILNCFNICFVVLSFVLSKYLYINRLFLVMLLILLLTFQIPQLLINRRKKKLGK